MKNKDSQSQLIELTISGLVGFAIGVWVQKFIGYPADLSLADSGLLCASAAVLGRIVASELGWL